MKYLVFFILIFNTSYSQHCNCDVVINPSYTDLIKVYETEMSNKFVERKHDIENEDFLWAEIIDQTKQRFKVKIGFAIKGEMIEGWIEKSNFIGIYVRNYDNKKVKLYSEPEKSSTKNYVLLDFPTLYKIDNCNNRWVHLVLENNDKKSWLEPEMQCANPYTICN